MQNTNLFYFCWNCIDISTFATNFNPSTIDIKKKDSFSMVTMKQVMQPEKSLQNEQKTQVLKENC